MVMVTGRGRANAAWCLPCVWPEATAEGCHGCWHACCHGWWCSAMDTCGAQSFPQPVQERACGQLAPGECSLPTTLQLAMQGTREPRKGRTALLQTQPVLPAAPTFLSPLGIKCFHHALAAWEATALSQPRVPCCCPSLRWRSGYVYTYSTKIKRHKYTQNAADSEQLIRVPGVGKTRMLEGWSGSSGHDGLCCLWSLLPEVTFLLCVCCSSLCSPVLRNHSQGCTEC